MTTSVINIGILGNGKSANRYHIPFILNRKEKFRLKAIYSRSAHNYKWAYQENVEYIYDLDKFLTNQSLDLIVICTPSDHYELAKRVLEHGHHCLVEKPFTDTVAQAEELFRLADSKNKILSAFQNRRYDSDFLTVQKVIESGKLGEIFEIETHFDHYREEIKNAPFFYHVPRPQYCLFQLHASHSIDQIISYFGKPERVHYDVRQLHGENTFNDYYDVDLYYRNLKISVKSSYYRIKERASFIVYGKKGMFIKENKDRQEEHLKLFYMPNNLDFGVDEPKHYGTLTYYDENGEYHEEKVKSERGDYARVYDDLYSAIVQGKELPIKPEDTIEVMKILEKGVAELKYK